MAHAARSTLLRRLAPVAALLPAAAAALVAAAPPAAAALHTGIPVNSTEAWGVFTIRPMPGTFPAGQAPDSFFPGLVLEIDSATFGEPIECLQLDATHCESGSPIPTGDYTVRPADGSQVPADWLEPLTVHASMDPTDTAHCQVEQQPGAVPATAQPAGLIQGPVTTCTAATIDIPGTWRRIGVTVSNALTDHPVAGASYELVTGGGGGGGTVCGGCDPESGQAATVRRGAATATATAASAGATSGKNGQITFPGLHLGGTYTVQSTGTPHGYDADSASHLLHVPAATYATLGQPFNGAVQLTPTRPNAVDDRSAGAFGAKQVIHVLANDVAVSEPLTVEHVGRPAHGTTSTDPDGSVTYTPDQGFAGHDSFTYVAMNALGARATATVRVVVHPAAAVEGEGDQLPFTGSRSTWLVHVAISTLLCGLILTAATTRRRRRDLPVG